MLTAVEAMWRRYQAKRQALAQGSPPTLVESLPGSGRLARFEHAHKR